MKPLLPFISLTAATLWLNLVVAYNDTLCQLERSMWMDNYREFHRAHRGANGSRYLVYHCGYGAINGDRNTCAGTGDRVRGMLYMLRVAAVHQMVFLAKWSNPTNLTVFLEPNEIDWRPDGLPEDVISKIGKDYNTFEDKDFLSLAEKGHNLDKWNETRIHTTTAWPASIVDHRIWGTQLWPDSGFLTLLGPLGGVPHDKEQRWIMEFNWYIDISSCWWHFAFKPTAAVVQKAQNSIEVAYALQPNTTPPVFTAWHWRTGGQHGEMGIIREESKEFFRSRMQQMMASINCARAMALYHAVSAPLLVVTDLNPFRKWIRSGAMGSAVTTLPSVAQHVNQGDGHLDAYIDVLADALVLSRAKCLLISQSGFSNTALMMRTGPLCYEHMDVCLRQQESFFESVRVRHQAFSRKVRLR
ncbi:hypothetical protein VaNZ11_011727 [Volvox africanus]|uniref:Uncharacterized protein n=1 Tax=Volvox africanus TaxID=51714 RepID=A0ABQ5SDL2_9CHLO|nr:hypothetical protein VaNZ11_011727 [Volvox africanus]